MDAPRLPPPPIDIGVFAQLRAALANPSVVAAAAPAKQLLASLAESLFTKGTSSPVTPRVTHTLPAAINRLASKLEALGIKSRELGQVLQQLRGLTGERAVTPVKMQGMIDAVKAHTGELTNLASGRGTDYVQANQSKYLPQLSPEQRAMWSLQQEVSRQAEAAAVLAAIEKITQDASNAFIQKIG